MVAQNYRPDIDGLRAFAVIFVLLYHAFPNFTPGGFIGVEVFFVISGYLISTNIYIGLKNKSFSFLDFYSRRIRRIFPALIVVLITVYFIGWLCLLPKEFELLGKHILASTVFISNFSFWNEAGYFDVNSSFKPLLHLWSLGIEEQFYIFWPLFLYLAYKAKLNLLVIALIILALSFFWNIFETTINHNHVADFYSPQTRIWELIIGAVLAYREQFTNSVNHFFLFLKTKKYKNIISIIGAILVIYSVLGFSKNIYFPGWFVTIPVVGTVLLLYAGQNTLINRSILSYRLFVGIGLISFPLYLWHWPLLSFMHIYYGESPHWGVRLSCLALSILLSMATYQWIEKPFRFGINKKIKTIALIFLIVLIGFIGWLTEKRQGLPFRAVAKLNIEASDFFLSNPEEKCNLPMQFNSISSLCRRYQTINPSMTIFVWGDSTALAWSPVLRQLAYTQNIDLTIVAQPSCPPILEARKTEFPYAESRKYCSDGSNQKLIIEIAKLINPNIIILLGNWNSYSPLANREFITDLPNEGASRESTDRVFKNKLPTTLVKLSEIGKTIVFSSWPALQKDPSYEINRLPFLEIKAKKTYVDKDIYNKESSFINEILSKVKNSSIYIYDPAENICDSKNCYANYKGTLIYADRYHLTPRGSLKFESEITNLILNFDLLAK